MGDPLIWRRGLGAVLILWSCLIGPEQEGEWGGGKPVPPKPVEKNKTPPATRMMPQAAFDQDKRATIDRQLFLTLFKRQAPARLLPCLDAWRPSPASLAVTATLLKSGSIQKLAPLDARESLPGCVEEGIRGMSFSQLTRNLNAESLIVQWRIDW